MFDILVPRGYESSLSFLIAPWAWTIMKAYLESRYMLTLFPWDSTMALMRAIGSAFHAEVPGTRSWAPTTLYMVGTTYPAHC